MIMTLRRILLSAFLLSFLGILVLATPTIRSSDDFLSLQRRVDPYFPDTPASCPICAQNYNSINGCTAAAPVLANFTNVIFNPGAFIDVIRCACTDTFQAVYPQCADCFIKTNQTDVLNCNAQDLPGVLAGMRRICSLASTLLGNVSESNGEVTSATSSPAPSPTTSSASSVVIWRSVGTLFLLAISIGTLTGVV